ncbi:hypothetical protein FHG64_05715 [Antarcticibacterium flavum]|uniref:Uncharacterized protein n=1 Tax=Antarcticibacterium flavum TaxID=2058175 RepID=A0A5B7X101_9FLAO|nr:MULTISPECIES: hypothetical protein [Antarcticibacterium]MCM4161624.1 hypothetical protein [Antarcticibacterium sp. W02-3]QCY68940.1 hypothetical protein FHG64_05715 [Antarcticibacterium flavum]
MIKAEKMDLKTRKLNVIEGLIKLQDEKLFSKIEALIQNQASYSIEHKPFTQDQLLERANKSNNDYLAGRVTSQEELESQSEKW